MMLLIPGLTARRALAALAAAAVLAMGGCAGPKEYSHYDMGAEFEKQGRIEDAIQEYQNSLTIDAADPTVNFALACAYDKKAYAEQAISQWEKALACGGETTVEYEKYGKRRSAAWISDGVNATKETRRKIQIAYMNYANALYEQGRSAEAIVVWKKLVALNAGHIEGWRKLGQVYKKTNNMEGAYEAWTNVARIAPTDTEGQKQLGYAAFATARLAEALTAFKAYVVLRPDDPVGYNNVGAVLAKQDKFPEALGNYDKALKMSPDLISSLNGKATAYYYKKDYPEAKKLWQKVLLMEPENETAKRNMRTLISMGY